LAADTALYSGVTGATVLDSGTLVVSGSRFAREETFEYIRRPDGGITLLNSITAADGSYRVNARFDLDGAWQSQSAHGVGLYDGKTVNIAMVRAGESVAITVTGAGVELRPRAECRPDCFINMSPSATAMFVMTRHYDFKRGGEQEFRWAGQDLDRVRTLSGGRARLTFQGEQAVEGPSGAMRVRHFTFVELLPAPDGSTFRLDFDLWTDDMHRPLGFRVRVPGAGGGTVALRKGYERLQRQLMAEPG
jgi:hypothetical protein